MSLRTVAVGLLWLACLGLPAVHAQRGLMNGVAALVNDKVITADEVEVMALTPLRAAYKQYLGRQPKQWEQKELEIKRDVLEELIARQLILAEFNTKGFRLPDSLLDEVVNTEVKSRFGNRLALTKELQTRNQTFEDFSRQVKEDYIVGLMRSRNVNGQVLLSPKKIEAYYNENTAKFRVPEKVKLRMIVMDKAKRPSGAALKLAFELVEKARKGGDFAELANSFSDDAARAKGGDRGWIEEKDTTLRKELREAALKLAAGEVAEPLDLEASVFVLKVEEHTQSGGRSLNEVRNEVETILRNKEFDRLVTAWMKRLREKAFVRYF
ncbi:MAG: hypothetical protein EXS36_06900 [Pedosphaera sp.]|nr:hypothetical protein [Pedosphaera sp.]